MAEYSVNAPPGRVPPVAPLFATPLDIILVTSWPLCHRKTSQIFSICLLTPNQNLWLRQCFLQVRHSVQYLHIIQNQYTHYTSN